MKALLTEQQATDLLQPHFADIRACLVAGWNQWKDLENLAPDHTIRFDSTTRAGIVHNHIVAEARKRFFNVPGVNVTPKGRMVMFIFDGRLVLRFKKFDDSFRTRNVKTYQATAFKYQMPMDGLPPEATIVVAGYQLTSLQDGVHGNWLVCAYGNEVEWKVPLDAGSTLPQTLGGIVPAPAAPSVRSAKGPKPGEEATSG